jgi:hypothetical protein
MNAAIEEEMVMLHDEVLKTVRPEYRGKIPTYRLPRRALGTRG